MPIQMPPGPPNTVQSYPGAPLGMVQAVPQSEIPDGGAFLLQDALVHHEGRITRRGPITAIGPSLTYKGCGLAACTAPDGTIHVGAWSGDSTHGIVTFIDDTMTTKGDDYTWPFTLDTSPRYKLFQARPALKRGVMIGTAGTLRRRIADIPAVQAKVTGTATTAYYGASITVDGRTYNIVDSTHFNNATANQINAHQVSTTSLATRLKNAINGTPDANVSSATTAHTGVTASSSSSTVTVTAIPVGAAGNGKSVSVVAPKRGYFHFDGNLSNGDTLTVGSDTFTCITSGTPTSHQFLKGGNAGATADNFAAAVVALGVTSYLCYHVTSDLYVYFYPTNPAVSLTLGDVAANITTTSVTTLGSGPITWAASTLTGGSDLIAGTTDDQALGYWAGGVNNDYTFAVTTTRGSKTVTAVASSFTTELSPGMWLLSGTPGFWLVGCVASIESNTSLTLVDPAPVSLAAVSSTFTAIRGVHPKVMRGSITCATGSKAVTGGDTLFKSQGLDTNWSLYRLSDFTFIGDVSTVASEFSLQTVANCAIAMADEEYVAIKHGASTLWTLSTQDANHVGFLTAVYAGRQWYANRATSNDELARIWFSDPRDPEGLNVAATKGDWIDITSASNQPHRMIVGLVPCYNSLLILKRDETFGLYGTDETNFEVRGVYDDGTLSTMTAVQYQHGAVWAGYGGIYFYDGAQVQNVIEDSLGSWWRLFTQNFNSESDRAWGMIDRDHYFLFMERVTSPTPVTKGDAATFPQNWCVVVNMKTGAVTMLTNLTFRGSVALPGAQGAASYYLVNTTVGKFGQVYTVLETQGVDNITTDLGTVGPSFYFESKKFGMEDPLILKRFKQLTIHHKNTNGTLMIDTIRGLNTEGITLTSHLIDTAALWAPHRLRFSKKTQYFNFRIYEDPATTLQEVTLGAYQLKYKSLRPGRV